MGRAPCCDKANVKKGPWAPEEDARLKEFIEKYGTGGNWIALPQKAGLRRCGKSCRLRWLNYLRPNIKHGEFSEDEDRVICSLYASIGSRWSVIAAQLPGRTDNDIKNYWNTKLKKKLFTMYPSLQEKPNLYPSMSFQLPLPPSTDHPHPHHHMITSPHLFNNSSSLYTFNPNFMNVDDNSSNPIFVHNDHNNVNSNHVNSSNVSDAHVQSPAKMLMGNCYNYLGFDQSGLMQECGYNNSSIVKEGMVMFGSSSSSTGCSSVTQMCQDGKQKYDQVIKQEDNYYPITSLDQYDNQDFLIKNNVTIPLQNEVVEEVKKLNFNGYLFHDGDENKTHYQKGMCSYYY